MSKINRFRVVNLNYNNNSIKIVDEIFNLNTDSALLSLRNGGGKSVLVQMLTAPFVNKKYRSTSSRPFDSYFTSNKATAILVEWRLDDKATYVLTGMLVRASQDLDSDEKLQMINFIYEYKHSSDVDISNIEFTKKTDKGIELKSYAKCLNMLEDYKKDEKFKFNYYDMSSNSASRTYFKELEKYQINHNEWESVICKLNKEESGLSNLFSNCKDVNGLVEKWFLKTIDRKLNSEENKVKNFKDITESYINNIKNSKSVIDKKDNILEFKSDGKEIENIIGDYVKLADEKLYREHYLSSFYHKLLDELNNCNRKIDDLINREWKLQEAIKISNYDKNSYEIYKIDTDIKNLIKLRNQMEIERESYNDNLDKTNKELHIFEIIKQNDKVLYEKSEIDKLEARLERRKMKYNDLKPKENELGSKIKTFYELQLKDRESDYKKNENELNDINKIIAKYENEILEVQSEVKMCIEEKGSMHAKMKNYGDYESDYNKKHNENLAFNLINEYNQGELDVRRIQLDDDIIRYDKDYKEAKQIDVDLDNLKNTIMSEEKENDIKEKDLGFKLKELNKVKLDFDNDIRERLNIFKYIQLSESNLYDTEKIKKCIIAKLNELDDLKNDYNQKINAYKKQKQRLIDGENIELTPDFVDKLADEDIKYTYGLNWLKNNKYDKEKNFSLIKNNPFIPYSIIVYSEADLDKLKQLDVYSFIAVPIILQTNIEAVVNYENIFFYTDFDVELLDEVNVAKVIDTIDKNILVLNEKCENKNKEYRNYMQKKSIIDRQDISAKQVARNLEDIEKCEKECQSVGIKKIELSNQLKKIYIDIQNNRDSIEKIKKIFDSLNIKKSELVKLCEKYYIYLEDKNRFGELERKLISSNEQIFSKNKLLLVRKYNLEISKEELRKLNDLLNEIKEKLLKVSSYESIDISDFEYNDMDISKIEISYREIISKYDNDEKLLQETLENANRKYSQEFNDLNALIGKYNINKSQYEDIKYDDLKVKNLEKKKEKLSSELEISNKEYNKKDSDVRVLYERRKNKLEELKRLCERDNPKPLAEIKSFDFDKDIALNQEKKKKIMKIKDSKIARRDSVNYVKESLSEFELLKNDENIIIEMEDINEWSNERISKHKGEYKRDYKIVIDKISNIKMNLINSISILSKKDIYQESFFKSPLDTLQKMIDNPHNMYEQLSITLDSFDNILAKLEADISVIDNEKDSIVKLYMDYIKDIDKNMKQIDNNSTIKIRDRSVKMLHVIVPNFDDNYNTYINRIVDYIDGIEVDCINLLNENKSAREYIDKKITTVKLYDNVVGNNNVNVKLYKIEASKEYQISWKEVSRNSGGEGFLSAFIILSSLLYFMRKDESDIWAKNNESKVLLMDNPFSKTQSYHLTKPLMDMAKKTNTQLICLSAVSGKDIYDRFDNIYVLDLIPSNYKSTEILESKQVKGNSDETEAANEITSSHIEVREQVKLF